MSSTDYDAKVVEDILGDWAWNDDDVDVIEVEDKHFYVIGLDPGKTTGVAILRIDTEDTKALPELVYLDQVTEGHEGFTSYFEPFYLGENAVVVSEKWVERYVKGADHEPCYIEGVEHVLWGKNNIVWQTPDMKSLVSDDWLREQNLWTEGKRHQMDALIHAIVFLRNDGHEGTVGALGGEGDGTMAEPGDAEAASGDGSNPSDGIARGLAQLARELEEYGRGNGDQSEEATGPGYEIVEPKGTRKERELGGAFMGFVSAEEGSEGVSLLDD